MKLVLAVLALGLLPDAAEACSVCFSGRDETREAFAYTAAFLTSMPLALIGGLVGWLVWQARRLDRSVAVDEAEASELERGAPQA